MANIQTYQAQPKDSYPKNCIRNSLKNSKMTMNTPSAQTLVKEAMMVATIAITKLDAVSLMSYRSLALRYSISTSAIRKG